MRQKTMFGNLILLIICVPLLVVFTAQCNRQTDEPADTEPSTQQPEDPPAVSGPYVIVDSGQTKFYNSFGTAIDAPAAGEPFYGQDANYGGVQRNYTDNGNGTVTDNNTGLMWQKTPGAKMTHEEAEAGAAGFNLAGYTDWRLPTIKELYSLIQFYGTDPSGVQGNDTSGLIPFIDTDYFDFQWGDPAAGERIIDSQFASSNVYVGLTNGTKTAFGVNFADGRIKGYGLIHPNGDVKTFYVLYVRSGDNYGTNDFADNGDGTVTDNATSLMWMRDDSGHLAGGPYGTGGMNWEQALEWAENLEYGGYSDWRLPNAKELQSIVDYTRSPGTTDSAAIDPVFNCTAITDEGGNRNFPFYWSGTSHANAQDRAGGACYVAFGEALGWMYNPRTGYQLMDVHGAGAQRSDPKEGNPALYPYGHGPQGDVIRIYNFVRCVRDAD